MTKFIVNVGLNVDEAEKAAVQIMEYDYELLMNRMAHDAETGCVSDPYEVNVAKAMADVLEYYRGPVSVSNKKTCGCDVCSCGNKFE